jgi:hypothetical protein
MIICFELQWSFLAAHQTILGKEEPIIDSDERSTMKHRWLPMPPRRGKINVFTISIPEVTKILLIGALPFQNVGGIGMPV